MLHICILCTFSHSHVGIVPQFMPYGVSFATFGANASLFIYKYKYLFIMVVKLTYLINYLNH